MATIGQYNLDIMTAAEVIDAAEEHLISQGVKSEATNDKGVTKCLYNGANGVCCGAAIFIQDYVAEMEEEGWMTLVEHYGQTSQHQQLVEEIQTIHDNYQPEYWPDLFNSLRKEFL